MKINENVLSKYISERESGKENLKISQIKEVQKLLLDFLATEWFRGNESGVIELIKKHTEIEPEN